MLMMMSSVTWDDALKKKGCVDKTAQKFGVKFNQKNEYKKKMISKDAEIYSFKSRFNVLLSSFYTLRNFMLEIYSASDAGYFGSNVTRFPNGKAHGDERGSRRDAELKIYLKRKYRFTLSIYSRDENQNEILFDKENICFSSSSLSHRHPPL